MRLGVDIGGTFTDVALEAGAALHTAKVLTTPQAPEEGVLNGIAEVLLKAGAGFADLTLLIHGTTLATNALIERKGARVALITTEGFRDSVEIGTESRFEQYDIFMEKPPPLVPRRLRFTVPERMDATGRVRLKLADQDVEALAPVLTANGVTSVAIGFLHSYLNPAHEMAARAMLQRLLPELPISLSCEVSPEAREYERISTTCANAYVQPLMARYLARLARQLAERGCAAPLFLMLSGGGVCDLATAMRFPIRLVESGPAGGAIFAAGVAAAQGLDRVLSFDMGGTTAKICLIDSFAPQLGRSFEVARVYRFLRGSGLPVRIPVVEMIEIGAGGGSIARIDALGRIQVGPQSAGAEPGPACYERGGTLPTVTDADLLLGRIDGQNFSGGTMTLDGDRAAAAVTAALGALDLPVPELALGIVEVIEENMAGAARVHVIESGKHTNHRTLVAFGGAAPLHAARLAEKLDIEHVVIPRNAGVGSAVGFLLAPVSYEIVRSLYVRLETLDGAAVNATMGGMVEDAERIVRNGAPGAALTQSRSAFMRYAGQGHEISVPLPTRELQQDDRQLLRDNFEAAYRALYHRIIPGATIEIMSWTVRVSAPAPSGLPTASVGTRAGRAAAPPTTRPLFDHRSRSFAPVDVYTRSKLPPGHCIQGPAMIVEDETATLVTAAFHATIDPTGAIVLRRRNGQAP